MPDSRAPDPDSPVAAAADRLRVDAATAEALRGLRSGGVDGVLLKGPALSEWLYAADKSRTYLDCDLWVPPGDLAAAEAVLAGLGFEKHLDERQMPDWWQEHGSDWAREADGVVVDLHWTLPGLGVDAQTAWDVLAQGRETVMVAGFAAPTLSEPARALHIALHAAQHGAEWTKALIHVARALAVVDNTTWREAATLAERLGATESLAAGLRLLEEGDALATRLGLPTTRSVDVALRASTPPPVALGFEQLARAQGIRGRARILWRKLVPPREFIRHWDPRAAESRAALALAYARRPFWLLRRAPEGLRAWRHARREVRARRG